MCDRRAGPLVALAMLCFARVSGAQSVDIEAEHQRGVALRNAHRDDEALTVFRGLYERTGEVRALARMALAEAVLGRWVEAEQHLGRALGTDDAWVSQNRASLEQAFGQVREHVGGLTVVTNVPGSEVFSSGQRLAVTPIERPLRVVAGVIELEIRAPRRAVSRRQVVVRPGPGVTAIDVELGPEIEAPPAQVTPEAAPAVTPNPTTTAVLPPTVIPPAMLEGALGAPFAGVEARRAATAHRDRWNGLAVGAFVAGGAGFLTAAIALGMRESAVNEFNSAGCQRDDDRDLVIGSGVCQGYYDRGEAATAVSIVGAVVGVAGSVAGALSLARAAAPPRHSALSCGPGAGASVVCAGSF